MSSRALYVAAVCLTMFACAAASQTPRTAKGQIPEGRGWVLGMQVCFPARDYASSPQVSAIEVSKTGWAAGGILRIGETTMHQPVFRKDLGTQDVRAAVIKVMDHGLPDRYYVVKLPPTLALNKDSWSSWQFPAFRTKDDPKLNLLHDKDLVFGIALEKMELEDSSPRIRFKFDDKGTGYNWIVERRLKGEAHDIDPCS